MCILKRCQWILTLFRRKKSTLFKSKNPLRFVGFLAKPANQSLRFFLGSWMRVEKVSSPCKPERYLWSRSPPVTERYAVADARLYTRREHCANTDHRPRWRSGVGRAGARRRGATGAPPAAPHRWHRIPVGGVGEGRRTGRWCRPGSWEEVDYA